jgi:hypothetical protein
MIDDHEQDIRNSAFASATLHYPAKCTCKRFFIIAAAFVLHENWRPQIIIDLDISVLRRFLNWRRPVSLDYGHGLARTTARDPLIL